MGVQLYTVRDQISKDLSGTLQEIARIGYQVVELAGYNNGTFYGQSPENFKTLLGDLNLEAPSGHYTYGKQMPNPGTVLNGWEKAVEDAAKLGHQYMVCAYLFPEERKTLDDYKKAIEDFNKAGEVCKKAGIQFCYHNHDFEFMKLDDQLPFDLMIKDLDPELVKFELDLYWITKAGFDAVTYFGKDPGRYVLWHVKDMAKTAEKEFTEVGNGSIDFKKIFAAKKKSGMQYFFVEQDVCKNNPPLKSIEISLNNLKQMKIV